MAAAHAAPTPAPAPVAREPEQPKSKWRARMEQAQQRVDYNRENGFNGVPLPEEPPEDPGFEAQGQAQGQAPAQTPEQALEQEQDELLEDLDNSSGEIDHRKPLDVAAEMIEKHLGGQRVR